MSASESKNKSSSVFIDKSRTAGIPALFTVVQPGLQKLDSCQNNAVA
jgi:hypothetical protein